MSPCSSCCDAMCNSGTDSKERAEFFIGGVMITAQTAQFNNLSVRHLGGMMTDAAQYLIWALLHPMAALCCHIPVVLRHGANKKVIAPDARRVVAAVQHPETFGNRSNLQLIANSMGGVNALRILFSGRPNLPIARLGPSADPHPASIRRGGTVNLAPEAHGEWRDMPVEDGVIAAIATAKLAQAAVDTPLRGTERFAACHTSSLYVFCHITASHQDI